MNGWPGSRNRPRAAACLFLLWVVKGAGPTTFLFQRSPPPSLPRRTPWPMCPAACSRSGVGLPGRRSGPGQLSAVARSRLDRHRQPYPPSSSGLTRGSAERPQAQQRWYAPPSHRPQPLHRLPNAADPRVKPEDDAGRSVGFWRTCHPSLVIPGLVPGIHHDEPPHAPAAKKLIPASITSPILPLTNPRIWTQAQRTFGRGRSGFLAGRRREGPNVTSAGRREPAA